MSVHTRAAGSSHAEELRIPVDMPDGVRCAGCVERVRTAVERLPGVHTVLVDARSWTIAVTYDPGAATADRIAAETRRLGVEIGQTRAHASYRLSGLD